MRAVVLTEPGSFEVTTVDDPTPARDEVVVEVTASGICGTDVHLLHGLYAEAMPVIPGHEFSGRVVEVGADVVGLAVGDHVAADPNLPCRSCVQCQRGRVNLCENYLAVGINRDGSAAEYVAVPAAVCVKLPGSDPAAALIEPLSCALHAFDVISDVAVGSRALLYGAGTMGLMMLSLARISGLAEVAVVDLNAGKLEQAAKLGASAIGESADAFGDERWDLVIDATGAVPAIVDGISRVRSGGTFLQFGIADPGKRIELSPYEVFERELSIRGAVRPRFSFERAARLYESGLIDPEMFISDVIPMDDFGTALDMFVAGRSRKILLTP
jgi:2-desacetyl-2-hydroxyethyl bacteriochlorophyllide A dehydrogenase